MTPPVGRSAVRRSGQIIRRESRAYLVLNVSAYGLVVLGFAIGLVFPGLTDARMSAMEADGTAGLVTRLVSSPALFALTILAVNVLRLSLLTIVLPSLVVPFAGLAIFGAWAVQTGITLVPSTGEGWVALIPHSVTLLIELQAYVLLLLGSFLLGKYWLRPGAAGAERHRDGYRRGLQQLGTLAVPALALLVIGAAWEAASLRYLVHPLSQWLLAP
ncbi:hypothetical protein EDF48_11527 [Curtobacterium sp. PhB191]|uniref:hypothetical protein n=1 Tax=Curtobacterium sp. PhB191 TaxID=2485202 RepID=UPI0010D85CFB|nr:hypothetical protein [Curtobacterium sp. PhB191]TCU81850.1 hypothetical protein EDF48_11527 [Curtobacterium sp. PhB191]